MSVTAAYCRIGEIEITVKGLGWKRWKVVKLSGEMADYVRLERGQP